jgi:hypothetical protein
MRAGTLGGCGGPTGQALIVRATGAPRSRTGVAGKGPFLSPPYHFRAPPAPVRPCPHPTRSSQASPLPPALPRVTYPRLQSGPNKIDSRRRCSPFSSGELLRRCSAAPKLSAQRRRHNSRPGIVPSRVLMESRLQASGITTVRPCPGV